MRQLFDWNKVIAELRSPCFYKGNTNNRSTGEDKWIVVRFPKGKFNSLHAAVNHIDTEITFNGNVMKARGEK